MSRPNSKMVDSFRRWCWQLWRSRAAAGEEKTLLKKYFMASKVSDNMTLSNIATVAFDPKTDGQMMSFSIVSVSEPKVTRPHHQDRTRQR